MNSPKGRRKRGAFIGAGALVAAMGVGVGTGLAVAGDGASGQNHPPDKAALYQSEQQQNDQARQQYAANPSGHYVPPPPHQAEPPRQPGIVDLKAGPFAASDFRVSNFFQGPSGDNWYLVYSGGASEADGQTAGLRIYTEPINPNEGNRLTPVGIFLRAQSTESELTITSVHGSLIQLVANNGDAVTFDLSTDQYN